MSAQWVSDKSNVDVQTQNYTYRCKKYGQNSQIVRFIGFVSERGQNIIQSMNVLPISVYY